MIKLERILSGDTFSNPDEESSGEIEEYFVPSKVKIPENKAFLSIALVDPQRTISYSLDELDRCMINKADLINSVELLHQDDKVAPNTSDIKVVNFNDSPNIHSLSTISEQSEMSEQSSFASSPIGYLERALDALPSSDSEQFSDQSFVENGHVHPSDALLSTIGPSIVSFIAHAGNNTEIEKSSLNTGLNHSGIDNLNIDSTSCKGMDNAGIKEVDFGKGKSDESVFSTQSKDHSESNLSELLSNSDPSERVPKSILKKSHMRNENISSEPTLKMRRNTLASGQFFTRDAKSLSYVDESKYYKPFPPKKKHSAPPRMQLVKLKSSLKINAKVLNSLKQSTDVSKELIDLLIMQAEDLNKQIKVTLLYNAIKYGSIVTAAFVFTCFTFKYCFNGRKC